MYCCNCGKELEDVARYCSVCGTARPLVRPPTGEPYERQPFSRMREGRKIAGVCGGAARYLDIDVTLVRILWIILTLFMAILPGIAAYVICWAVMPEDPLPLRDAQGSESDGASSHIVDA